MKAHISVLPLLALPLSALAQTAPTAPTAPTAETKTQLEIKKEVTPYGVIITNVHLLDTGRQSTPNTVVGAVRFGLRASYGIAKAGIETQLNGNARDRDTGATTGSNTVSVRRADLGIDLPSKTSIHAGRVRPGGAYGWGADTTLTPGGFGGVDGVRITQQFELPAEASLDFGLAYLNSLRGMTTTALALLPAGTYGSMMDSSWAKSGKAYLFNMGASFQGASLQVYYGFENQAISKHDTKVTPETATRADASEIAKLYAADASHLEVSLGYDQDNYGFGAWYVLEEFGKGKSVDKNEGGKLTLGSTSSKATRSSVAGVGFSVNSKVVGLESLLQKGDFLTLMGGYTLTQSHEADANNAVERKNDPQQYTLGLGYDTGALSCQLALSHEVTENKTFSNPQGSEKSRTSAQTAYLNTVWSF